MSFLFKSSKKGGGSSTPHPAPGTNLPTGLPPATRDIRSSDGPASASSHIPPLNGASAIGGSKPGSPTPGMMMMMGGAHAGGASVNNSLNSLAEGMGRSTSAPPPGQEDVRPGFGVGGGVNGVGGRGTGGQSPEQKGLRDVMHPNPSQRIMQAPPRPAPSDPSPYPWSQRRLTFTVSHTNPFPRYGAAVNATASKDGSIYLMGGLINGSTVKGDLWMVEAGAPGAAAPANGSITGFPVATTSEGPGPRVGHASLLVGNAFIVFGGDTKMDEGDLLDDTLYLLNTSTKQWSRALPAGPRPPGRYGHTLNILGSKIYIFGGQMEGYFFNDLVAFDLNALQQATNRWEILIQNTIDGGPPHGQIPPARTNHTMISYNDRLYLFGGTDGVHWYNDVWSYSPHTNSWTMLECIGYIPSPREGHAAALVGDVMYIFGGRTEEGNDLGDLAAFRITSRRWYTFQNMGPSPSPRSGHSMTTVGKQIVVLAGEPSSAPRDPVELGLAYYLDTSKIRYPADSASRTPSSERVQGTRRPSGASAPGQQPPNGLVAARSLSQGPQQQLANGPTAPAELADRPQRLGSGDSFSPPKSTNSRENSIGSRLPRMTTPTAASTAPPVQAPSPAPTGPPPQAPRMNGVANTRQPTRPAPQGIERALSPSADAERARGFEANTAAGFMQSRVGSPAARTPAETRQPTSPGFAPEGGMGYYDSGLGDAAATTPKARQKPETYQPSQQEGQVDGALGRTMSKGQRSVRSDTDRIIDSDTPRQSVDDSTPAAATPEQLPKVRELREEEEDRHLPPQDSGIGSSPAMVNRQYEDLAKELESVKKKNAWFASELALARKSGYNPRAASESPILEEMRAPELFAEDDRPLVEALLQMKAELVRVQERIEEQAKSAAQRIAEAEGGRDAAVKEAVFAKARLAGQMGGGGSSERGTPDPEREGGLQRKLAAALQEKGELQRRMEGVEAQLRSEKRVREVAEETAEAARRRVGELEQLRAGQVNELEGLRGRLAEIETAHRELRAMHSEVSAQHKMLGVEKEELSAQLEELRSQSEGHAGILGSLREAVQASTEKAEMLERRLEEERQSRGEAEQQLRQLRIEHEERKAELDNTQRRLRDAEELAERHAQEAKTHRSAVLAGLGKVTGDRDRSSPSASDSRLAILQQRIEEAQEMVRQDQAAADTASQKLRSAEERIAGLEAYQQQASREGLGIRKQLQGVMREKSELEREKAELEQRLQGQMLEANALHVQHSSLKDILSERGINASDVRRSRALDSPSTSRFSTPDLARVKELEQQLEASLRSHEEMKGQVEEVTERERGLRGEYEEKLASLDQDHQAAVKYLRGTEKMLSKMKQELQRVKNENGELRKRVEKAQDEGEGAGAGWESEKRDLEASHGQLRESVKGLEGRIEELSAQLHRTERELQETKQAHGSSREELESLQRSHDQSRSDLERLRRENSALEHRARDAESKVQLLLDQVEHSVDNYRRQSRLSTSGDPSDLNGTNLALHHPHQRNLSGGATSMHSRTLSEGGESEYSVSGSLGGMGDEAGRNSMALDTLASELDALRSQWESSAGKSGLRGSKGKRDEEDEMVGVEETAAEGGWREGKEMGGAS